VSRRDAIAMSDEEVSAFLAEQRVVVCATNGAGGWPHLMPLWYVVRDGEVWAWTYARSQKIRNLERDDRATLQVEDGEEYQELRGVMLETHVVIHRELEVVAQAGAEIFERYSGGSAGGEAVAAVTAQAAKRVALQFVPVRVASWDHRKLAGVY
jgi:nitroimidazol reductase NimA-like FMN-containing flavoprotein (pyridoxamine 5'-phosphate oxidase superfamily)